MSNEVVNRLKNIEALVRTLKEDRASNSLQKTLSPLIREHADDLKHCLNLMLDAVNKSEHADEGFIQVGLVSSQIENGFRNLTQNIASTVQSAEAEAECRNATQLEFEEQVEILKRNNAEFDSALRAHQDAQGLLEKGNFERDIDLVSQSKEIERLKSALSLAQSQRQPEGVEGTASNVSTENAEHWELREAELVSKHNEQMRLFTAKYRALFEEFAIAKGGIRVVCRVKGENAPSEAMIKLQNPDQDFFVGWTTLRASYQNESKRLEARDFEFQRVFGSEETNQDIFDEVKDFATSAVFGTRCTVMGYGASGSGKSYTFLREDGLVQSYVDLLFKMAEEEQGHCEYKFQISAVEIYLNKVYDLLQTAVDSAKVEVRLNGESTTELNSREAAVALLGQVIERREMASTLQNATSSRSHFILTVKTSKKSVVGSEPPIEGQIRFLDLAGSEKVGKNSLIGGSGPQKSLIQDQGTDINQSLLDLGKGIRSLATRGTFIPSHNLTRYIRSSLSPGSRLLVVATVSSLTENQNNTLNTLKWSQDATGRPSQGKLVTQGKAPVPSPPRNSKVPAASGSAKSTPTKRSVPSNQGNIKR